MSSEPNRSGQRRKDYVAYIAVGLFVLVMILELLLVTWLPRKMITEKFWERDEAQQELVGLMDKLRRNMRGGAIHCQNSWQEGEVDLALSCLDEIAKYLRDNQDNMDRAQIRRVYKLLRWFEIRYNKWAEKRFCVSVETIDIEPLLRKSLEKYHEKLGDKGKSDGGD